MSNETTKTRASRSVATKADVVEEKSTPIVAKEIDPNQIIVVCKCYSNT